VDEDAADEEIVFGAVAFMSTRTYSLVLRSSLIRVTYLSNPYAAVGISPVDSMLFNWMTVSSP
jgi:hypothetical protein